MALTLASITLALVALAITTVLIVRRVITTRRHTAAIDSTADLVGTAPTIFPGDPGSSLDLSALNLGLPAAASAPQPTPGAESTISSTTAPAPVGAAAATEQELEHARVLVAAPASETDVAAHADAIDQLPARTLVVRAVPVHDIESPDPEITDPEPAAPTQAARLWRDAAGAVASAANRTDWLIAQRDGITAADARRLLKRDGSISARRDIVLEKKRTGRGLAPFDDTATAADRIPGVAALVERYFQIAPNRALCVGDDQRHLASPDGLGDGTIAMLTESTASWASVAARVGDDLQWQLHVTDASRALLAVSATGTGRLQHGWVERDDARIALLVREADALLHELDAHRG